MVDRLYELLWDTVCFVNLIVLAFNGWAFKKNQESIKDIMTHLAGVATNLKRKEDEVMHG